MKTVNRTINAGDSVRLLRSSNPYVPVKSILRVESLPYVATILNVTFKGQKYHVHVNDIEKVKSKPECKTFVLS